MAMAFGEQERLLHDILNALTIIVARCDLMQVRAGNESSVSEIRQTAMKIAGRIEECGRL